MSTLILEYIVQGDLVSNILISLFKYDSLDPKNGNHQKKKEIPENIFSPSLHTILAVIKWIPGCTIFHFTDPAGWTKLMKAEFSETRLNKICQTGTNEQFAFQCTLNFYSYHI